MIGYEYLISWIAVVYGIMLITIAIDFLLMYLIMRYYYLSPSKGGYWNSRSSYLQGNRWMRILLPYVLLLLFTAIPLVSGINELWLLSAVPLIGSIVQIIRQHASFRADGYRYLPVCLPCGILIALLVLVNYILHWR